MTAMRLPIDSLARGMVAALLVAAGLPVRAAYRSIDRQSEIAGATGPVGANEQASLFRTLRITQPDVYENILVDGEWIDEDLVRINADHVVLRHCTIRHGTRDALEIYGR